MGDYKEVYKHIDCKDIIFMFRYCKRLCNILEILMLSKVNEVFKELILILSLPFYILATLLNNFSKSLKTPLLNLIPPFIMNLRVLELGYSNPGDISLGLASQLPNV